MSLPGLFPNHLPGENPKPGQAMADARARIIWGDPAAEVRDFLVENGVPAAEADAKIKTFVRERLAEIRKTGLRNTLIGAVLLGLAAGGIYLCLQLRPGHSSRLIDRGICALALIGAYGFWKLATGLIQLFWPQSEHEAISDLNGSDPME